VAVGMVADRMARRLQLTDHLGMALDIRPHTKE
jgi:hypothetical protein